MSSKKPSERIKQLVDENRGIHFGYDLGWAALMQFLDEEHEHGMLGHRFPEPSTPLAAIGAVADALGNEDEGREGTLSSDAGYVYGAPMPSTRHKPVYPVVRYDKLPIEAKYLYEVSRLDGMPYNSEEASEQTAVCEAIWQRLSARQRKAVKSLVLAWPVAPEGSVDE